MITEQEFMAYEGVKSSGEINMFNIGKVMEQSGLSQAKILAIMKNYDEFKSQFVCEIANE